MKIENTKAQMRKGVLEFCILSVLKELNTTWSELHNAVTLVTSQKTTKK